MPRSLHDAERFTIRDLGSLNGTFVNRQRVESAELARRRRGPGRQVPDDVPPAMTTTEQPGTARLHTIGEVCRRLQDGVSRHLDLEDPIPRGSGSPLAEAHARRLSAVHGRRRRAPRDDPPAPARRVPAATGDPGGAGDARRRQGPATCAGDPRSGRRRSTSAELCERAGVTAEFARELEEYGLLTPRVDGGERLYRESEADIATDVCADRPLRDRRAPSARLPHRRGPPVGAARAARRPGARSRHPGAQEGARSTISRRSPRSRVSCTSCCFCAICGSSSSADERRPRQPDPGHPGLPDPGDRLQGHHAARRRPGVAPGAIDQLAAWAGPRTPDMILGAEARGFIFGGALAYALGCGFVPARKPGKLPWQTVEATYALEYGNDTLEVHADSIARGPARDRARRRARHRWHGEGEDRARREARRQSSSARSS